MSAARRLLYYLRCGLDPKELGVSGQPKYRRLQHNLRDTDGLTDCYDHLDHSVAVEDPNNIGVNDKGDSRVTSIPFYRIGQEK